MKPELYKEIALVRDIPEERLCIGDVATLIDFVLHPSESEKGAVLEIFNAVGESIAVITVPLSSIAPLQSNQIPAVRSLLRAI